MCGEEPTCGICAIDLEAFVLARELLAETEVVKCGGDVEEFRVEPAFLLTSLLSREQVDADGVIKSRSVEMLTQDVSGVFRQHGIGDSDGRTEN
jgi:hypothetical protein